MTAAMTAGLANALATVLLPCFKYTLQYSNDIRNYSTPSHCSNKFSTAMSEIYTSVH